MSEQNERGSRTGRSAGPHKASKRHKKNIELRQWSSNEERVQYLIKLIREFNYVCPSQANNDTKVSLSEKIRGDIAHKFRMTISKVTIDHILKEEIKKYEIRKRDQSDQVIGDFERDLEQILEQMKINERRKDESIKKKREKDRRRQYTSEVRKTSMESMPETHQKLKRTGARQLPREATPVRSFFEGDPLIKNMLDEFDARAAVNAAKRAQLLALIETAEAAANYRHQTAEAAANYRHAQSLTAIRQVYSSLNQASSYESARTQPDVSSPSEN